MDSGALSAGSGLPRDATPASHVASREAAHGGAPVTLQSLTKTFATPAGAVHALRDVSLAIPAGSVFGIIGRSGAGKSTLIRCINRLETPTHGRVLVDGHDLGALDEAQLRAARRRIGMIFQHFNLLSSRTVYGNVALPLELQGLSAAQIRRRVEPLLELVGLATLRDRYVAQISGGQKQRVGIARALASEPRVLLSDEATSALDPETTGSILALLSRINRELGLTIVLITHQMPVVQRICDRVAVLDAGHVVEQGTVRDVFAHPQATATRALVGEAVEQGVPAHALQLAAEAGPGAQLWKLPVGADGELGALAELLREPALAASLIQAHVENYQGSAAGSLWLLVRGDAAALQRARLRLAASGLQPVEIAPEAAGDAGAVVQNAESADVA